MLGKIKLLSQTQHTIQIDKNTFAVIHTIETRFFKTVHDQNTVILDQKFEAQLRMTKDNRELTINDNLHD